MTWTFPWYEIPSADCYYSQSDNVTVIVEFSEELLYVYKYIKSIISIYYIHNNMYRTRTTINRGYNYFFLKLHVGFSLMISGIPLKMRGYKTRAIIHRACTVNFLPVVNTGNPCVNDSTL